jgi:D-3-phosphoglycerate dehydrogenase
MKIVLAEKVSPATLAVFAAEPGWDVKTHDQLPDGLAAALADADALVVRSAVQVDDALMEKAPKLRVIGRAGVGVDNIDAEAATRRGIVVMNTPGANAVAVAELTIGLMLALARKLPAANASMHAGKWEKKNLQGAELRGKTLGILGLGRIGLEVARRARGFGLESSAATPLSPPPSPARPASSWSRSTSSSPARTTSPSTSASRRKPPASSTPRRSPR